VSASSKSERSVSVPAEPVRRLRLARLACQLSQDQLAEAAGITRQAVAGFEAGRFDPSLKVALRLSRVLGRSVDELFSDGSGPSPVHAQWVELPSGAAGRRRVALADVGGRRWAYPLHGDMGLASGFRPAWGTDTGTAETGPVRVGGPATVTAWAADRLTLVVAGCDPALPLLAGPLARQDPPVELLWWSCSSARALQLVQQGAVHVAGAHLRDPAGTGYNAQLSREVLGSMGAAVLGFAAWDEGLVLAPNLSGSVETLADVARHHLRVVNREPGAEARAVMERQRTAFGLEPADLVGWDVELRGHVQVAAAVASGLADAGVTAAPVAAAYDLPFVPLAAERFDLVVPRHFLALPEVRGLLGALGGDELARQVQAIDGYDAEACGTVVDTF